MIHISDHACRRYVERVMGVRLEGANDQDFLLVMALRGLDFGEVRCEVLPGRMERRLVRLGDGVYPVPGREFRVAVKGGVVTTVMTQEKDR